MYTVALVDLHGPLGLAATAGPAHVTALMLIMHTVPPRLNASLLLPTERGLLQFNASASGPSIQLPSDVQAACASSPICANDTALNLQVSDWHSCATAASVPSSHARAGVRWLMPLQVAYYSDSSVLTSYLVAQFGTDWLGIGSTQEAIGEVLMLTSLGVIACWQRSLLAVQGAAGVFCLLQ